jgi:hypothetical protein
MKLDLVMNRKTRKLNKIRLKNKMRLQYAELYRRAYSKCLDHWFEVYNQSIISGCGFVVFDEFQRKAMDYETTK